jgi:hypothetical protein
MRIFYLNEGEKGRVGGKGMRARTYAISSKPLTQTRIMVKVTP